MSKIFKLLALLTITLSFTFSACSEDSPNIPDTPKPTPDTPKPTPDTPKPTPDTPKPTPDTPKPIFDNIKFTGNGIIIEITPEGDLPNVTYPFKIEGNNMFLDKNINGVKDVGEEIADNFYDNLSLPKKDGKALFVVRGDIKVFWLSDRLNDKSVGSSPEYPEIKDVRYDASMCKTLENISTYTGNVSAISVSGCKELKKLRIHESSFNSLDIKGLYELEALYIGSNKEIKTGLDLSDYSKLYDISLYGSKFSSVILPRSNSCKRLNINNTNITSLDMSRCINLKELECGQSKLTSLDITNCSKLMHLNAFSSNELTEIIDKNASSGKPELKELYIGETPKLTKFDFSKYVGVKEIYAHSTLGISVEELIDRIPVAKDKVGTLTLSEENAQKVKDNQKLKEKGWTIKAI